MGACISRTVPVTMEESVRMETIRMDLVITITPDIGDMAVEAAFPQSGISQAPDGRLCDKWYHSLSYDIAARDNKKVMSMLQNGTMYRQYSSRYFLSGSRPEGLAMENNWGHDETDVDLMEIWGGVRGVHVAGGQQSRGEACLEFRPEGCPVAYTKLQVTDRHGLKKNWPNQDIDKVIHISGDRYWLNTYRAARLLTSKVSGPAAQIGEGDWVTTYVSNGTHPDMYQEFCNRPRHCPCESLISELLKMPMLLVLLGHKLSPEFKLQARISWSHLELKLIQELPESVRQGYISCKYVLKHFLNVRRGRNIPKRFLLSIRGATGCRSYVCSYHTKTVFLRYLVKTPPSVITSPFTLFLDLLYELDEYLNVGKLPHYFLAKCDLLETVKDDELHVARQVIGEILSDPLKALLTTPTRPQQIYGKVHPDCLVVAFRRVFSHPTCEQRQNDLFELLARVDERRRERYTEQCESDEQSEHRVSSRDDRVELYKAPGRAELVGLVDMLKQIKHI